MLKAGAAGFVIGAGVDAIAQFRRYKNGEISSQDYLKSVVISGGHKGAVGAAVAGIMIPVKVALLTAGLAAPIAIPIGFAVAVGLDKLIAPIFKRGDYAVQLAQAQYYNNLNQFYSVLEHELRYAGEAFTVFVMSASAQQDTFGKLRCVDIEMTEKLKNLHDAI